MLNVANVVDCCHGLPSANDVGSRQLSRRTKPQAVLSWLAICSIYVPISGMHRINHQSLISHFVVAIKTAPKSVHAKLRSKLPIVNDEGAKELAERLAANIDSDCRMVIETEFVSNDKPLCSRLGRWGIDEPDPCQQD